MRLEWDSGTYSGPVSLVAIGNGPRSGGLFYMAPHADMADGRLTFVYGYRASRWQLLRLLQSVQGKKLVLEPQRSKDSPGFELVDRYSVQADIAGVAVALVRRFDRGPAKVGKH